MLLEIAAQSCALMNRIVDMGVKDCFLGKIKDMTFCDLSVTPAQVRTSAQWIFSSPKLTQYKGTIQSLETGPMAHFNLFICTADKLSGVSDLRAAYWSHYLERLMGLCDLQNQQRVTFSSEPKITPDSS
jgi:hypothetical protein